MDKVQVPVFYKSMSDRLSVVMDTIGVSDYLVSTRRDAYLKRETMRSIFYQLSGLNIRTYHFGSQTEGTTTIGMDSDLDTLDCQQSFNMITDHNLKDMEKENMFLIQNDLTPPGHCRLHQIDFSTESDTYPHDECIFDEEKRLILENKFSLNVEKSAFEYLGFSEYKKHGPSGSPFPNKDIVNGFPCKTWPIKSSLWLDRPRADHWLSRKAVSDVLSSECFIVSVGHQKSENEHVEWRISFSKSERVLLFNMNNIQIKCYVLLKLIKNEILKPIAGDKFTSFHCKITVLFTIERLPNGFWVRENLLSCLYMCLKTLQMFLKSGHCPHIFNPDVNLFAGKITLSVRLNLLQCITNLINDHAKYLLSMKSDSLGTLLTVLTNTLNFLLLLSTCISNVSMETEKCIIGKLIYDKHVSLYGDIFSILSYTIKLEHSVQDFIRTLSNYVKKANDYFVHGIPDEKVSAKLIMAYLRPFIASLLVASSGRKTPRGVYSFVNFLLTLMDKVFCIDVASSKLKLATLYYVKGDIKKTRTILKTIEKKFGNYVVPVCGNCDCIEHPGKKFVNVVNNSADDNTVYTCISNCVTFLRQEYKCCPLALRYEMFRSTTEDAKRKKVGMHEWMDMAEIDAQPSLYFMQFLVYKRLGDEDRQYDAIFKLASLLQQNSPLYHKETAFNLLGQCWEFKDNQNLALICYDASLRLVDVNNAAKWHLSKLVYRALRKSGKIKVSQPDTTDGRCCYLL
ncbi:uncharacterized protein LOC132752926 [Ruditapes philippinarum]|uniref:uncharacterized protein LOC132752926 n=1 Tax=Ruditapes philippinarum TaxID=129788 RepID=UPI00295AA7C1|nr:uncharacterized protein LOC132752926 [Ruditapes philippinarum]XP_060599321.1 uncharacterized protein LOC132752926 [Ruditapes philippinarum]